MGCNSSSNTPVVTIETETEDFFKEIEEIEEIEENSELEEFYLDDLNDITFLYGGVFRKVNVQSFRDLIEMNEGWIKRATIMQTNLNDENIIFPHNVDIIKLFEGEISILRDMHSRKYDLKSTKYETLKEFVDEELKDMTDYQKCRFFYLSLTHVNLEDLNENLPKEDINTIKYELSLIKLGVSSHAILFSKFCKLANIQFKIVKGFTKDEAEVIDEDTLNPHSVDWNIVRLKGYWFLIDSYRGSIEFLRKKCSVYDEEERGKKIILWNEVYFMTPPGIFICSHFPKNHKYQILARKIFLPEFFLLTFNDF